MSWASCRQTTRLEDLAYCLIGFFGVNIPLLYGEGERAFIRLQEEIIRISDDQSIFAWTAPRAPEEGSYDLIYWRYHHLHDGGLLARSPSAFKASGNIVRAKATNNMPFALTNRGIHLQLPFQADEKSLSQLFVLDCVEIGYDNTLICIYLERTSAEDQFLRTQCDILLWPKEGDVKAYQHTRFYVRPERPTTRLPNFPSNK
jgi:hypothetical protein